MAKSDALEKAGQQEAADKADKWVFKYDDKMYERGYFRDSYNSSSLLWLFELSWWRDVSGVLVDKDGKMSPRNAKRFLQMLADREPVFESNLTEAEECFWDKYERLKALLRQAIDRKECIQCSLCSEAANGGFRRVH